MKNLFTSTLLTVAAVPFLMAAPHAAKKVQAPAATQTATTQTDSTTTKTDTTMAKTDSPKTDGTMAKTKAKKHVKKVKSTETSTAAPATPSQK